MKVNVCVVRDPFHPTRHREVKQVDANTVRETVPGLQAPHIVNHNGQWIMRDQWDAKLSHDDVVIVVVLPEGGGGSSNPLRIILMIAVAYFAPMIAGKLAPSLVGTTAGKLLAAGIQLAGGMLVNMLIPPPKPPTPLQNQALASPSPTYNLQAQGNMARLGYAIPVHYGRMVAYPDFAAEPYTEYVGNEQFLYQLFCLGQGEYDVEAIRIEDTAISNWDEITYEIVGPSDSVTLFPNNVDNSVEVAGQDLPTSTAIGPFIANAANTDANAIAVDVVAPRGVYYANDSGGLSSVSITFKVEAREVDDSGTPVGSFVTLGTETISGATTTPQRRSYRYNVAAARYEVQVTRTDTEQTDSRYGHDLVWAALRAYMPDTRDFGNVTLIAMRMKATSNLSQQASRKINVIATRKLNSWDPSTGWTTTPAATRSIAWAIADAAKASYGGGLSDSQIDLQGLYDLDTTWSGRGDYFDGRFENQLTFWEALTQLAQVGRAKPYMQGGILYFKRDEAQTIPVALYSMRNIVKNSLSIEYIMPTEDSADSVEMHYFDNDYWYEQTVICSLPGSSEANPTRADLFGVTERDQAYREGVYLKASDRYRRKIITYSTEMEGFIPSYGDLIAISHDMPQWGQSGELTAVGTLGGGVDDWSIWNDATRSSSTAVCPDGSQTAYEITDDSITLYESIFSGSVGYTDGDIVAQTFWILKDATATHFCRFDIDFIGGTTVSELIRLDVTDGSYETSGAATLEGVIVEADGIWWKVSLSASSSGNSNTGYRFQFYPAVGATPFTEAVSATGTTTIWFPEVTLTGSEDFTFETNRVHYIGLRKKDGSVLGPFHAIAGATSKEVIITGLSDTDLLNVTGNWERTHYSFGWAETWRQRALVLSVRPSSLHEVEITCVNEDDNVHTAEDGITTPSVNSSQLTTLYTAPVVAGLTSASMPGSPEIMLLSWQPAPGADHYLIEVSEDGSTWTRIGETRTSNYTATAIYQGSTIVRVAAVGLTKGPWVQIAYGDSADYMWTTDSADMWDAVDTTLMWNY